MADVKLKATMRVKLSKFDNDGKLISVDDNEVELTDEEVRVLCLSQTAE